MAKKNQSVFTFPQTSFWDKAYQKADELKKNRSALTNAPQPEATKTPSIGQSYNKMIGGDTGIGSGGFYNSMAGLEAASMRLADAASKRTMEESEKESDIQTKALLQRSAQAGGYLSPTEMQFDIRRKREEDERKARQRYELERQAQIKSKQFLR